MKVDFKGKVTKICPTRTYGKKQIQAREFRCSEWTDKPSKYPNILPFEIQYDPTSDKFNNIKDLDKIAVGDLVSFSFWMRGHVWDNPKNPGETRVFVTNKVCSAITVERQAAPSMPDPASADDAPIVDDGSDPDMPF